MMASSFARGRLAAHPHALDGYPPETHIVIRIYYDDISDLMDLQSIDIWEYNNLAERYVLAAVDSVQFQILRNRGWRLEIDPIAGAKQFSPSGRTANFLEGYRTVEELYENLEEINLAYPELSELVDYGQSHCLVRGGCTTLGGESLSGYPLRAIRVTNEAVSGSSIVEGQSIIRGTKPVFFLMANIHSREITTPEIAMRFLNHLLDGYGVDPDASWLVDYHEIWIVPTANPDGHWLVKLGMDGGYNGFPFFQRKNANNDVDGNEVPDCTVWPPATFQQYGIDLNRNHSFGWGGPGTSALPCDMTFRGPSAASEVEVAALENLIRALILDQRASGLDAAAPEDTTGILITLHSFSNLVLWPWGDTTNPAPNMTDLKAIGDRLAVYNGYQSCQPSICLYLTSGSSDDWAYGELGIPALTFELGEQFMPPYSEIDNRQWPENRGALIHAAKIARTPYMTVHGPDIRDLLITTEAQNLTITATADDSLSGGLQIASSIYSIDTPPWEIEAVQEKMDPNDGEWDTSQESVSTVINKSSLSPGRHILFAQGQDIEGNWGPVSAAFFDINTEWRFEKSSHSDFVAPGGVLHYEISVAPETAAGNHQYSFVVTDPLSEMVMVIPESIRVNGLAHPEIYDPATHEIRYESQGNLTGTFALQIDFTARVNESSTTGELITNQAILVGTIDGLPISVPPATNHTMVLATVDQLLLPLILRP